MLHFVISIGGIWDRHPRHDNQFFFQRSFAKCLVVSAFKVSNDLDNYLPRHSIFKNCLESDVHHMTSQILSILIDFILDSAFFAPFFRLFFNYLNLNSSGTKNDIKKQETAIFLTFKGLSDRTIKIFMSFTL